jgi:lipopolysaccharide/colanic/teichoic acid biosynthesis glycosyltransferase
MQHALDNQLPSTSGFYSRFGKRALDIALAGTALLALSPVWLIVALLARTKMGSPVLFRQQRPGLGGRPFTMNKFRTMDSSRDKNGDLLPDEERLKRFGGFLRTSSLDEIPELLNVILGDMSLVGPRPFLMEHVSLYSARQARRHEVRPGITGWAQINGRHQIPFSKRIELDIWYIDHMSLWLDLRILLLTVPRALASHGVKATERDEEIIDIGRKDSL